VKFFEIILEIPFKGDVMKTLFLCQVCLLEIKRQGFFCECRDRIQEKCLRHPEHFKYEVRVSFYKNDLWKTQEMEVGW
jgi:hypothetical protein